MFWPRGWALITAWALIRGNTVFNLPYRTVCKCNLIIIANQPIRVNISKPTKLRSRTFERYQAHDNASESSHVSLKKQDICFNLLEI